MLAREPRIMTLWDQNKRELDVDKFEDALSILSTGEVCMARFFASV